MLDAGCETGDANGRANMGDVSAVWVSVRVRVHLIRDTLPPTLSECVYSWMLRNAPPGARCGSSSRRDKDCNSHRGKAMSLSASQALAARRSRVAIPEDAHFVGVAGNKKEMTTVGRFPGVAATACLLRMRRTA